MKKGTALLLALAGAALTSTAWAIDYTVDWQSSISGDLTSGYSITLTGTINMGGDVIHNDDANFLFPNAFIGDGTGVASGTINISCDITAPGPYKIDDLWVDELGQLIPGIHATAPFIEWRELIKDVASGNTLISDNGTDYTQPKTRHYVFTSSAKIHVEEVFVLGGVTYIDDTGKTVIDGTATAALPLVEKQVSIVPEPSSIGVLFAGLGIIGLLRRRRA